MQIKEVVKSNLCISCGLCALNGKAQMIMKKGVYIPKFLDSLSDDEDELLNRICPGRGYDIVEMGNKLFKGKSAITNYKLGAYQSMGVATSNDKDFLRKSSSGGLIPTLANYLLDTGEVDGVLTVRYKYSDEGPTPYPFIAVSKDDLILSQGSKYSPIPLLEKIDELISFDGNLAVIGTPCQIAGIRLLTDSNDVLKAKIKFTISNFCGGYRDYRETKRIFEINNVKESDITEFSYRGDGQPGKMSIYRDGKEPVFLNYPDYSRLTGYIKHYRCRLCVDATGELADIAFGDAWLPKYLNSGRKWSVYICRSSEMKSIVGKMLKSGKAEDLPISADDLLLSQKGNIYTKKERQYSRYKLYKFFGYKLPLYDGGFNKQRLNLFLEVKVIVTQFFMYMLEKIGLYLFVAKKINRIKNEDEKNSHPMS